MDELENKNIVTDNDVNIKNNIKKDEYTVAESYTLPSKALIYDPPFNPVVKLKAMTVADEMKRVGSQDGTNQNLCEIVDKCLITELPISSYDMCMGDYEYLVHKLRVVTYGAGYKMLVGCPKTSCNAVYTETFNLDELKVKEFDLVKFEEYHKFILPVSKQEIKLKMYTPRLEDTITRLVKEKQLDLEKVGANMGVDYTPLISLQCMIDTIDSQKYDFIALQRFIQQMNARDYNYIMTRVNKAKSMIGLDKEMTCVCGKCGKAFKTYFRFSKEFFGPEED